MDTARFLNAAPTIRTETSMNKLMTILILSAGLALAGCNTIAGAGKDIESGGEAVQDTARDVQKKM